MIQVTCPSCEASYDQDERRLPPGGLNMRCPKCRVTFHLDASGKVSKPKRLPKKTQVGLGAAKPRAVPPPPPLPPPVPARARPEKKTMAGIGASEDLSTPFDDMVTDLPAPRPNSASKGGLDLDLDLDLPGLLPSAPRKPEEPEGPASRASDDSLADLDLPSPRSPRELDFPGVRSLDDFDLPAVRAQDDVDLPAPRLDVDDFGDLDLPAPRGVIDLPRPSDALDLPAPKELTDLPIERGSNLPALKGEADFGELDLPFPASGEDLPIAADDSDLPQPRRAGPVSPSSTGSSPRPVPNTAGGVEFGELELPSGPREEDELEFAGLPQGESSDSLLPRDIAVRPEGTRRPPPKRPAEKPKRGKAPMVLLGVIAVAVAVGAALGFSSYGLFGRYAIEQLMPAAADATPEIQAAESTAQSDTYEDVRTALQMLGMARGDKGLNYELLARSIVHENLSQLRFGEDAESEARVAKIRARLEERDASPVTGPLAEASSAVLANDHARAESLLQRAVSALPRDPLVHLVAGELALNQRDWSKALREFQAAANLGSTARAQWGIARALLHQRDPDVVDVIDRTLELSPRHADARLAKARWLARAGEEEEALQLAQEAIGGRPVDGQPIHAAKSTRAAGLALLGEIHEAAGRTGRAGEAYSAALGLDPFRVDALLGSGRVLLDERRWRDALTKFEEVVRNQQGLTSESWSGDPPEVQARIGATQALLQLDRAEHAREQMGQLGREHADNINVMRWLGKIDEALGEHERAEQYYRRMIELAPDRIDGYMALADLFAEQHQYDQMAETLNQARENVAESVAMRVRLGEAELARDQVQRALGEFRRAMELDEDDAGALFGMGVALRRSGSLSEASQVLGRLGRLDPNYPGLTLEQGQIYEAQGRAEDAAGSYRAALATSPNDIELKLRLGGALVSAGQVDEAEEVLGEVMRLRSNSAEAEHYMGRVHFLRGDRQVALRHFDRSVALDPTQARYLLYLGWAHLEDGQLGRAIELSDRAISLDPNLGDAYWIRGRARLRAGAVNDALEDLQRALARNPGRFEAHASMAEAYDQLRRGPESIQAYLRALEHDSSRGDWWYRLGKFRLDQGQLNEAHTALTRSIEIGSAMEPPPRWLPLAYRARGDASRLQERGESAVRDYNQYLATEELATHDRREVERWVDELTR